ncbi:MAG: COX15/CtaA family protein, partial [Xanthomonadales bacterium]|nr:COX15/CtaA family protein [Xanthomonadales bacterium]
KLFPLVVMGHLLGGMATLAVLVWILQENRYGRGYRAGPQLRGLRPLVLTALTVLVIQIALGGWTTANYAAMVCPDVPTCQGEWWPETDFREGFVLWREIGVDFEGGVLDLPARTAIQISHRIGAVITLVVLLYAGFRLARVATLQRNAVMLITLVIAQFTLGVLNIVLKLPLVNAVAHNGVAALLLAVLVGLAYRTAPRHA